MEKQDELICSTQPQNKEAGLLSQEKSSETVEIVDSIIQHLEGEAMEGKQQKNKERIKEELHELSVELFKSGSIQKMIDLVVLSVLRYKLHYPNLSLFDRESIDKIITIASGNGIDKEVRRESVEFREYIHKLTSEVFLSWDSSTGAGYIVKMLQLLNADGYYSFIPKYAEIVAILDGKLRDVMELESLDSKKKNRRAILIFERALDVMNLGNRVKKALVNKVEDGAVDLEDIEGLKGMTVSNLEDKIELPETLKRFRDILVDEYGYEPGKGEQFRYMAEGKHEEIRNDWLDE